MNCKHVYVEINLMNFYKLDKNTWNSIVVDPTVCCRPCRLLPLPAFQLSIQALINKMMCHPAD